MIQSKRILFTESATVDYGDGPMVYEAGTTYELREDKAKRWVKRNKAVYVDEQPFCKKTSPVVKALPFEELEPLDVFMAKQAEKQELANQEADAEVVAGLDLASIGDDAPIPEQLTGEPLPSTENEYASGGIVGGTSISGGGLDLTESDADTDGNPELPGEPSGSPLPSPYSPRRGRPRGSSNRR